jgi:O-antigen/teichoic acid export membrane protein
MSIKKNTTWNLLGSIAPMLIGVVTIPYLIKQIELEAFGILTLVWALIGYFSVFDFGIGRALTHLVSSNRSDARTGTLPAIVKNGLLTVAIFGAIGGLVLAASAHQFGFKWLNVSTSLRQSTVDCLLIAAVGIPLTTIVTGLRGVLEGFEDFRTTNILRVILGCANFGLPAVSAMLLGPSLEYMVASLVAARLVILIAHWIAVDARISDWSDSNHVDKKAMSGLLSFGAWMTLSNIVSPLMVTADRFIISALLGAAVVAFYTVPFDVIVRLLVVPAALTGAVFPRFSHLFSTNMDELRRVYRKCFVVILGVMLPLCALIGIGSFAGLSLWLGTEFAKNSWLIASILSLGLLFNGLAQIPHAAIQASGNIRATALLHVTEFMLYVPLLYGALKLFGLAGAAMAWVARVLFDLLVLLVIGKQTMARTCP